MRPAPFEFHRAENLAHALSLLEKFGEDARPLAAGQSLVPMMNLRLARPEHLIDITGLKLDRIEAKGPVLRCGALVRHVQHLSDPLIAAHLPVMREGVANIGHPVIRRSGTLGGSLSHADPTAELPLLCLLHDAEIVAASTKGERRIPAAKFFLGAYTTALEPEELLVAVEIPTPVRNYTGAFLELAERRGDFAIAACGVLLRHSEGRIDNIAIACSGAGDVPLRAIRLEACLAGRALSAINATADIGDFVNSLVPPENHSASAAYRRSLLGELIARALARAADQARGER